MNNALDAAALAIGSWSGLSQDQLTAKAQQFFDANYSAADLGSFGKINVGLQRGRHQNQARAAARLYRAGSLHGQLFGGGSDER
jgi:hypothetical protein